MSLWILSALWIGCGSESDTGPGGNQTRSVVQSVDYLALTFANQKQLVLYKKSVSSVSFEKVGTVDLPGTPVDLRVEAQAEFKFKFDVLTQNPNSLVGYTFEKGKFTQESNFNIGFKPTKLFWDTNRYWISDESLNRLYPSVVQGAPIPVFQPAKSVSFLALTPEYEFIGSIPSENTIGVFSYSGSYRSLSPMVTGEIKSLAMSKGKLHSGEDQAMSILVIAGQKKAGQTSASDELAFGLSKDGQVFSDYSRIQLQGSPKDLWLNSEEALVSTSQKNTLEIFKLATIGAYKRQIEQRTVLLNFDPGRVRSSDLYILVENPGSRSLFLLEKATYGNSQTINLPDDISTLHAGSVTQTVILSE